MQSKFDEWKFFNLSSTCITNCVRCRFLITQFVAIKLWVRILLQIGDSPLALFLNLCVNFHKCVSVAF